MRKILFLTYFVFAVGLLSAQQIRPEALLLPTMGDEITATSHQFTPQNKAYGDFIWGEDFGGGALPAGWTVYDGNSMDFFWYWSNDPRPGITGTYSTNNDTFYSETADNGYMMISGDIYNAGGGSVAMDSYVKTGAMAFDTVTSALITWKQYFRYCCSSSSIQMLFSISTDGINWVDFDVRQGVAVNAASPNPQTVELNITPYVAGQPVVYFKWYKGGASHYFWAIDDIKIVEAPMNDLVLETTYISNFGSLAYHSGYYSRVPLNQLMPVYFAADVVNNGNAPQTNVNAYARVYDSGDNLIYTGTDDTTNITLVYDSLAALEMSTYFTAPGIDTFSVEFEAVQTETDENAANNVSAKTSWLVTENKVMSRDIVRTGYCSPSQYVGAANGDYIGANYYITNNDTASSISVYIDYRTVPGTQLRAVLFKDDAAGPVQQITSEEYVISKVDLGQWITLPLIAINPTDVDLIAQQNYIAGFEFYFENVGNLWIGADNSTTHLFNLSSVLRVGSSWYYFSNVPHVRLNLGSAVVMPNFTSTRLDTCPENWIYTYQVSATDPSGLPITFSMDDYYGGALATINDHGDGTATITSTAALSDLGFASGGSFRLRVFATNGISRNEQYFYVSVKDYAEIGIEESDLSNVQVYPNPANNVLNVKNAAGSQVVIYNLLGEAVQSVRATTDNLVLDVTGLSAGSYIVRISGTNGNYSQQLNITR